MSDVFESIWAEADQAARWAVSPNNPSAPREQINSLDCGFAWVVFSDGRHPFVRWCRKAARGDKHWRKGWYFWMTGYHRGQSIDVHMAAAKAFAEVLRRRLPEAEDHIYADGRLD